MERELLQQTAIYLFIPSGCTHLFLSLPLSLKNRRIATSLHTCFYFSSCVSPQSYLLEYAWPSLLNTQKHNKFCYFLLQTEFHYRTYYLWKEAELFLDSWPTIKCARAYLHKNPTLENMHSPVYQNLDYFFTFENIIGVWAAFACN